MPTPTNPTPEGDWRPFTTKGAPLDAEYRQVGRTVEWRLRPDPSRFAFLQSEVDTLAALLDGVLADDPQAIRDAAAWLTVNRPEVTS